MYRCVNNKKKNDERKGTFFELGSAQPVIFYATFVEKGYFFIYNFTKGCRSKRICVLIYYIGKGYFLTGHGEKR